MGKSNTFILGAGVTGLACGYSTGFTVFEKNDYSGGICSSYYMKSGSKSRSNVRDPNEQDYRFEYGGGHWIFGNDPEMQGFISTFDTLKSYERRSSVYLPAVDLLIPFPIQNNLRYLPEELVSKILSEILDKKNDHPVTTLYDWCGHYFGKSLSDLFFHPFHELYTAGLWKHIQPQDGYKSPVNFQQIRDGASSGTIPTGYNVTFLYPSNGLNTITSQLESKTSIRFRKEISKIDIQKKIIHFTDGLHQPYERLISTLPLNMLQNLTGIKTPSMQDPYTSVLVFNIGAKKGIRECADHWIYFPASESGFHRLGYYSNVSESFLPKSKRNGEFVSIYVEKAYKGGENPSDVEINALSDSVINELQSNGFIGELDVVDPTWIDVAYTWSYPGSTWKDDMIAAAEQEGIFCIGRYAQWKFQGILDSLKDGLKVVETLNSEKRT